MPTTSSNKLLETPPQHHIPTYTQLAPPIGHTKHSQQSQQSPTPTNQQPQVIQTWINNIADIAKKTKATAKC